MAAKSEKVQLFLQIFESILKAREIDVLEQDYTQRGEAFFHVSGAGHENVAFLNPYLIPDDYLHCHYRDKSLMLARGVTSRQFFLSLFAKDQSHSRGRQMSAHLSDPSHNVLSLVGPVGNNALQAAGLAEVVKNKAKNPIVLCALGDGMSQQGEVLEAIAHAVRETLPVLFLIEDNNWAISTKTQTKTFYDHPEGPASEFYGIPITRVDGRDPLTVYETFGNVVTAMRADRKPAIVVFQVSRLNSHTNADDQRLYRTTEEIEETRRRDDPILFLRKWLVDNGVAETELDALHSRLRDELRQEAIDAQDSPEPEPCFTAKADLPKALTDPAREYRGTSDGDQITMLEAIREVLKTRLSWDEKVSLFGEDLEDPKGDVFGITKGLSQAFPGRVRNSPLAESTIVGVSVGRALAGDHPVAFLQFADFFPIAYNQIFAELGSMHWRTDGGWRCPVIIMATCGGFKPGLGPFHASSMESIAVHTPGLDVYMPATAGDAAGLLNAAFESQRPTIFFYPKSSLNDRSAATSRDVARQIVAIGKARIHRKGDHFTFVGWGNTVALCDKAAQALEKAGVTSDVIDLRSLSPWDADTVVESVRRTGRLIIAQEDSLTASMASEISATVAERLGGQAQIRRVSRPDTHVPFHFENQLEVLPSYKRILTEAVEMLGGKLTWIQDKAPEAGFSFVEAAGSSPSDESVTVLEWKVKVGDDLKPGQMLAEMEADKAAFELACPLEGKLVEILVPVGDMVKVGTPLLKIATGNARVARKPATQENPGTPSLELPASATIAKAPASAALPALANQGPVAGIAGISIAPGSRKVSNEEISRQCPEWTPEDIYKRIGIESRFWANEDETAVTLAVKAARELLAKHHLTAADLTAVFCSTGTPVKFTPSTACLVLAELSRGLTPQPEMQAADINSACSGYLYTLQAAYDHLLHNPAGKVLVLSTEVLSRRTDPADYQTAPIFGDAATATLVVGADNAQQMLASIDRPVLSAKGENGDILRVPLTGDGYIYQDGPKVYVEAIRHMIAQLEAACSVNGLTPNDLDLVIAHQANQRILNAVRQKTKLPVEKVFSNIRNYGNTSSNTIPLSLYELLPERRPGKLIGLTAFGGGFTFGAAVLHTL
ncbi:MAG: transketolase [Spirochaetales bacterium]|nr:transketolase [Spirochaetales bacterium]